MEKWGKRKKSARDQVSVSIRKEQTGREIEKEWDSVVRDLNSESAESERESKAERR